MATRIEHTGRLRMKESNYWEQFYRSGKIEDYLHYRTLAEVNGERKGSAVYAGGASFTASFREEDGAGNAGPHTGDGHCFEGGTHRGI